MGNAQGASPPRRSHEHQPSLFTQLSGTQRRALLAAFLGWMLDGMDSMLYAFALPSIAREFQLGGAAAGGLASITLLSSAVGGVLFGWLADRIGRARALTWSIAVYSLCTAGAATAGSLQIFVVWRLLLGLGLGGEWAAGAVLVAESVPSERRGQALGWVQAGWAVGYALAALLSTWILPRWGFRALFWVGASPALLALWVRWRIAEPPAWQATQQARADERQPRQTRPDPRQAEHARPEHRQAGQGRASGLRALLVPPLRSRAILAALLSTLLMFAYWGLFTWIPSYLAAPPSRGGAGLSAVRALSFLLPMQAGAFAGYVSFGVLADRFGRRPVFAAYVLSAALAVPVFIAVAGQPWALVVVAPVLGFAGHGYFSVFGALLAELFPSTIRGSAQGFCYNIGRAASAVAPLTVGALADGWGLGATLSLLALLYGAAAALIWALPETRGHALS